MKNNVDIEIEVPELTYTITVPARTLKENCIMTHSKSTISKMLKQHFEIDFLDKGLKEIINLTLEKFKVDVKLKKSDKEISFKTKDSKLGIIKIMREIKEELYQKQLLKEEEERIMSKSF